MKTALAAGLLASALLYGGSARAQSVQTILKLCKLSPDSVCVGYIAGIGDMMFVNGLELTLHPPVETESKDWLWGVSICEPMDSTKPTKEAEVQAFVNWANAHPEKWGWDELPGVKAALLAVWPCPQFPSPRG